MPDKKQKAKAKAIKGGMPQNVADKVFKMKSPEVAYMAKVAGSPAMEMDKVMYQDPEDKKTEIIGGQPQFVRQKFDSYRKEISSTRSNYDGARMAKNYLGGRGNRASEIPTREAVGGGKQTSADYAVIKGMVKDSLTMVNKGQGFKAQQLYGKDLGKDFKKYGNNPEGLSSLKAHTMYNLRRSGVTDGNYSKERKPYPGQFFSGGNIPTNAPYLQKNPQEMDGGNLKKFKTKFYRDDQTSSRARKEDASNVLKRAFKRGRNAFEQN